MGLMPLPASPKISGYRDTMVHSMIYLLSPIIVIARLPKSVLVPGIPLLNLTNRSLFHAVVDTDETARRILEVLIKEKAGRITFIPLNTIRVKPIKYPVGEDGQPLNETVPILERIEPVDEKFRSAIQSVYSRTIVCTRLETAAELAREWNLEGVTLNGSRSDRKGALTGGYHDVSHSRLQAAEKIRKWRGMYEEKASEARKTKARVEEIHQEVTRLVGVLKNAKSKRMLIDEGFGPLQRDLQTKYREENALRDLLSQRVSAILLYVLMPSNNP